MSHSENRREVPAAKAASTSLRQRIREASQHLHDVLDHDSLSDKLMSSSCTVNDYRTFLVRTYGFVKPLENLLKESAANLNQVPVSVPANRSDAILLDLRSLGMTEEELSEMKTMKALPKIESVGNYMGVCYVLEGSMMGGLVLAKQVSKNLGLSNEWMKFFLPEAPRDTVVRFQKFTTSLDSFAGCMCDEQEAMESAMETFRLIGDWFLKDFAA